MIRRYTADVRLLFALVAGAGLFPAVAAAQPYFPPEGQSPPTAAPVPRPPDILSATFTPLAVPWHIFEVTRPDIFPIVALSLELRAHPRLGIAVMGLAGDETDTGPYVKSHEVFYEIGVEPRCYLLGGFRGLMAGAALHYFRVHMSLIDNYYGFEYGPYAFAGYTYGPFVGYKYTAHFGFTFEVKAGFEVIERTMSDAGNHPNILPITDAKVGWSF